MVKVNFLRAENMLADEESAQQRQSRRLAGANVGNGRGPKLLQCVLEQVFATRDAGPSRSTVASITGRLPVRPTGLFGKKRCQCKLLFCIAGVGYP